MALLLKIVGGLWAILGVANIVSMPSWTQPGSEGILTFGLLFNMLLFVIPGLVVFGVGAAISKKAQPATSAESTTPGGAHTKKCPFCAEDIQSAAIVCRYCGRDLPAVESSQVAAYAHAASSEHAAGAITLESAAAPPATVLPQQQIVEDKSNEKLGRGFWYTIGGLGLVVVVLIVVANMLPRWRPPSAARPEPEKPSVIFLVVTISALENGWRINNDTDVPRGYCIVTIAGHTAQISNLPANQSVDVAASAFSGGGLPNGTALGRESVSVVCERPEHQAARVYFGK